MLCAPNLGARAFPTGYARLLVPDVAPPCPFAAVTMVTIEHESGKRLSKTRIHWEFGYGVTRNQLGSCVIPSKAWTSTQFANLRKHNLYHPDLLGVTRVRVEAWAHPDLLGYALDALLTNCQDNIDDIEGVRAFTVGMGIAPHVNEAMPLDPAEWRAHPAVASGVVRCE